MGEQELARRCADKDMAAQRELYEEYRSRILALCRRYAENPADAEDLMQDTFIKIFRNIGSFHWTRPGSLYSWMSRIAVNLAFDTSKRRRRLAGQLVDVNQLADDIPEGSVYDETASVPSDVLNEMIEALPEGYRTVFKLYCIEGFSHREIADLLGIREKSSSASLSRAKVILADAVRQYWRHLDNDSVSDGWTSIIRKMHREKTVRNISLMLVLLIPVVSLMLWQRTLQSYDPAVPYISQITPDAQSLIVWHSFGDPQSLKDRISVIQDNVSAMPDNDDETVAIIDRNEDLDINPASDPVSDPLHGPLPDVFSAMQAQENKTRRKITFGFRAGSGTGRRNTRISLASSKYVASLTDMNTFEPSSLPASKVNSINIIKYYPAESGCLASSTGINDYRHDMPITIGLTARTDINSRIGAECGVEYTYMHSNVKTEVGQLSQNLHFIGVPVRLDTRVWSWNKFDIYAGLGAKVEKCASYGDVRCEEIRLQWSAETYAGIQYKVSKHAHLYFQPDISYYFTKTDLITYRTEHPLTVSMNLGLRFDL